MVKSYKQAGVNIDAGKQAVDLMKSALRSTYDSRVLSDVGSFGGLFDASKLKQMSSPVLVASTDGVGTKTKVAARLNRWDTLGQDLVNHCINDIAVQGAEPLFFLDYIAADKLRPEQLTTLVEGMAKACLGAECILLGGETAEMPDVYQEDETDVAGTIIGLVDRSEIIDGRNIEEGDAILGLPSTGLHTNGYSLARRVLEDLDWTTFRRDLGASIGDALLAVHRCYLDEIRTLLEEAIDIRGLAHITGGGIIENLPRILPEGLGAEIWLGSWKVPPIFDLITELGEIEHDELFRVFNMGLGMLVVLPTDQLDDALELIDDAVVVGEIVRGKGVNIQ